MRKRIAKRWRKELLRKGAVITHVETCTDDNLKKIKTRKHRGYWIEATYLGFQLYCLGNDELDAYRLAVRICNNIEERLNEQQHKK